MTRHRAATVVVIGWRPTGGPGHYEVRVDQSSTTLTVNVDDIGTLSRPTQPEPALP